MPEDYMGMSPSERIARYYALGYPDLVEIKRQEERERQKMQLEHGKYWLSVIRALSTGELSLEQKVTEPNSSKSL